MIDLHMIDSGKHPENFKKQIDRSRHPKIRLQVAQPVWGNVAEARRLAYQMGDHPFVSWIDDDDEVLDVSWVDGALEILQDQKVSAVYPRSLSRGVLEIETPIHEWKLIGSHNHHWPYAHHFTIMRREYVPAFFEQVGDRPLLRDQDILLVASMARYGKLVAHPSMAYQWNLLEGTARSHVEPPELHDWCVSHWRDTVLAHRALT